MTVFSSWSSEEPKTYISPLLWPHAYVRNWKWHCASGIR